ncbi:MAG: RsmE family RNA methyltransferase [Oligosphaeraceae bacterium]
MSNHRFHCPGDLRPGQLVTLPSTESSHALKVLRLRPGETVTLLNGRGDTAEAVLQPSADGRRLHDACCLVGDVVSVPAPTRPVRLYVAPPKSHNMELVLKSATELGVSRITPIVCQHGVSRGEAASKATWQGYLVAALKQSGNPWLPELTPAVTLREAIEADDSAVGYLGAVPRDGEQPPAAPWRRPLGVTALWIGPEGGFTEEEERLLRAHGCLPLTVGDWILRVETAVAALLGCLSLRQPD